MGCGTIPSTSSATEPLPASPCVNPTTKACAAVRAGGGAAFAGDPRRRPPTPTAMSASATTSSNTSPRRAVMATRKAMSAEPTRPIITACPIPQARPTDSARDTARPVPATPGRLRSSCGAITCGCAAIAATATRWSLSSAWRKPSTKPRPRSAAGAASAGPCPATPQTDPPSAGSQLTARRPAPGSCPCHRRSRSARHAPDGARRAPPRSAAAQRSCRAMGTPPRLRLAAADHETLDRNRPADMRTEALVLVRPLGLGDQRVHAARRGTRGPEPYVPLLATHVPQRIVMSFAA